jgi:hypothetical protein
MRKDNPDRPKAIWYLDAATNLNPRFLEAIQMKQELTGEVLTTSDNSSIRSFVSRAILADNPSPRQPSQDVPREVPIDPTPVSRATVTPPAPRVTPSLTPSVPTMSESPSASAGSAPMANPSLAQSRPMIASPAVAPPSFAKPQPTLSDEPWDWQPLLAPWTDWMTRSDVPLSAKIKMIADDQPTILTETSDVSDANR